METEEITLWKGSPSQWTNVGAYLVCALLAAGVATLYFLTQIGPLVWWALALPMLWAGAAWLRTKFHIYEVTTERILVSTGILSRRRTELELYRVRDYQIFEPLSLRLIGRGNLQLITSDRTSPSLLLHAVPDVVGLKDKIRTNTEIMRRRHGVRDLEINPPPDHPPAPVSN